MVSEDDLRTKVLRAIGAEQVAGLRVVSCADFMVSQRIEDVSPRQMEAVFTSMVEHGLICFERIENDRVRRFSFMDAGRDLYAKLKRPEMPLWS